MPELHDVIPAACIALPSLFFARVRWKYFFVSSVSKRASALCTFKIPLYITAPLLSVKPLAIAEFHGSESISSMKILLEVTTSDTTAWTFALPVLIAIKGRAATATPTTTIAKSSSISEKAPFISNLA